MFSISSVRSTFLSYATLVAHHVIIDTRITYQVLKPIALELYAFASSDEAKRFYRQLAKTISAVIVKSGRVAFALGQLAHTNLFDASESQEPPVIAPQSDENAQDTEITHD